MRFEEIIPGNAYIEACAGDFVEDGSRPDYDRSASTIGAGQIDTDRYGRFDAAIINEDIAETSDLPREYGEMVEYTPEEMLDSTVERLDEIDTVAASLYDAVCEEVFKLSNGEHFFEKVDHETASLDREITVLERVEANYRVLRRLGGRAEIMETEEVKALVAEAAALRGTADTLSIDVFKQTRDDVVESIDWHGAIVDAAHDGAAATHRLADFLWSCNEYKSPALTEGYKNTMRWTQNIWHWREKLFERGHALGEGVAYDVPEGWQPNESLMAETHEWCESVQAVQQLMCTVRAARIGAAMPNRQDFDTFEKFFLTAAGGVNSPEGHGVPLPIAHAVEQFIAGRIENVREADRQYRERPVVTPTDVQLGAYEDELKTLLGSHDPEYFIRNRLKRFPASLVRHLGAITCEDSIDPIVYPDGRITNAAAVMDGEERQMLLNMSPLVRVGMIDIDQGISGLQPGIILSALRADRQEQNRTRLGEVVDHEVFHHVVQDSGPLEWLVKLHNVSQTEKVDVTPYITKSRTRGVNEGRHEDHADSGAYYLNHPWSLRSMAVSRFETFHELIGRYTEDELMAADVFALDDPSSHFLQDNVLVDAADERARFGVMWRR